MSVTLVPCHHAALCRGRADDILDSKKIGSFCDQHVTGFIVICDRICEKVPFSHTKFDPFLDFKAS